MNARKRHLCAPVRARVSSRGKAVPQMETAEQSDEESRASFQQAKLQMQAAIYYSLDGQDEAALKLFKAAKRRFTQLHMDFDAGIARAWMIGLKKHEHERTPA